MRRGARRPAAGGAAGRRARGRGRWCGPVRPSSRSRSRASGWSLDAIWVIWWAQVRASSRPGSQVRSWCQVMPACPHRSARGSSAVRSVWVRAATRVSAPERSPVSAITWASGERASPWGPRWTASRSDAARRQVAARDHGRLVRARMDGCGRSGPTRCRSPATIAIAPVSAGSGLALALSPAMRTCPIRFHTCVSMASRTPW